MGAVTRHRNLIFGVLGLFTIWTIVITYMYVIDPMSMAIEQSGAFRVSDEDAPMCFVSMFAIVTLAGWAIMLHLYRQEGKETQVAKWLEAKSDVKPITNPGRKTLEDLDFGGRLLDEGNKVENLLEIGEGEEKVYSFGVVLHVGIGGNNSEEFYRVFLAKCGLKGHHRIIPKVAGLLNPLMSTAMKVFFGHYEGLEKMEQGGQFGERFDLFTDNPEEAQEAFGERFASILTREHRYWPFTLTSPITTIEMSNRNIALLCEHPKKIEDMKRGLELIKTLRDSLS